MGRNRATGIHGAPQSGIHPPVILPFWVWHCFQPGSISIHLPHGPQPLQLPRINLSWNPVSPLPPSASLPLSLPVPACPARWGCPGLWV